MNESPAQRLPLVVLTATIDPFGCNYLVRAEPDVRREDYLASLRLWMATPFPVLMVENSGAEASAIQSMAAKDPERVEFLQFEGNRYPRHLGKGYGEMEILRYALEHSRLLKEHSVMAKVTGRLFIANYELLQEGDWLCERGHSSKVFVCETSFIPELLKTQEGLDDSQGVYFEHAYASARRGFPFVRFSKQPIFCGHSGTSGRAYPGRLH